MMSGLHAEYRAELQTLALIVGVALLAATGTVLASNGTGAPIAAPPTVAPTARALRPTPVPSVVAGPLDGVPTARSLALRRPLAVMIDDFFPDARPVSGINKASVVFEAPTEGGITRLMALYLERDAARVGPIRSARPYFVSWAAGFNALFVHAGGSPAALQLLRRTPSLGNVEAIASGGRFSRETDRVAPHDLYGSTGGARAAARGGGTGALTPGSWMPFAPALRLRSRGRTSSFSISFSTPQIASPAGYTVTYRYALRRNVYLRSQGGVPFIDRSGGAQVTAKNVVVMFTHPVLLPNDPVGRISLGASGGGRAVLFQNGRMVQCRWSKPVADAPLVFTRADGSPVSLVPGQTWIEATASGDLTVG